MTEPTEPSTSPLPSVPFSGSSPTEETLLDDDMGAFWRDHRQDRQTRHQQWKEVNTQLIEASGLPFTSTNNGESLLFRQAGKPRVDFYPSTGRWRCAGDNKTHNKTRRGGAQSFLQWYERQTDTPKPGKQRRQQKTKKA